MWVIARIGKRATGRVGLSQSMHAKLLKNNRLISDQRLQLSHVGLETSFREKIMHAYEVHFRRQLRSDVCIVSQLSRRIALRIIMAWDSWLGAIES